MSYTAAVPGNRLSKPKRNRRQNQQGQSMGAKGARTLERLTQATAKLLETKPLRDLRVADIARAAKTSPGTFYLYFTDVDDAVLAVNETLSQSTPELLEMLAVPWPETEMFAHALAFVRSYLRYWRAHRSVFHARNLAADEGDQRFVKVRANSITPLLFALSKRIATAQKRQEVRADLHAPSTAGVMIAMLERVASVTQHNESRVAGITAERMAESTAYVLAAALGGNRSAYAGDGPHRSYSAHLV